MALRILTAKAHPASIPPFASIGCVCDLCTCSIRGVLYILNDRATIVGSYPVSIAAIAAAL
eukprot:12148593-Heterocapsa_arctica.AAC.1